ncbi:DUF3800 domain-containing protein [Candidatus Parabeggiatoa sp. HSG14]|uniref:DUF3800 domain-containing protein n=1 Tax=Candidatus Parabeggiatoa sp. HSG14 TaxID=3055593 RepID=UPI0025A70EC2|nr:DUF3800 domain-containing protein [Thiotrichales bacterium HSG14]
MNFLYTDESGDNGFSTGSTELFVLAGLSVESQFWKEYFWKIKNLRQEIVKEYGLIKFNELKGSDIFSHRGHFFNSLITPTDLANIYENIIELICDPLTNLFVSMSSYFIQLADILAFSMNRIMTAGKKGDVITMKPEIADKLKKKIHLKSNIPDAIEKGLQT